MPTDPFNPTLDELSEFLARAFVSARPDIDALAARAKARVESGEDLSAVLGEMGTATWILVIEAIGKSAAEVMKP